MLLYIRHTTWCFVNGPWNVIRLWEKDVMLSLDPADRPAKFRAKYGAQSAEEALQAQSRVGIPLPPALFLPGSASCVPLGRPSVSVVECRPMLQV